MSPTVRPSVDCLVGLSICHNILKGQKFYFHAPIEELVYLSLLLVIVTKGGDGKGSAVHIY